MKVVRELPITAQLKVTLKELGDRHLYDLMFVVSDERAKVLLGDNPRHTALVEVIGNFNPVEVIEVEEEPEVLVIDPVDDFVADVCDECVIPEVLAAPKKRGRKKKAEE